MSKPYDYFVVAWLDSQRADGPRTAFLRPDDVLEAPMAAMRAIRLLIGDGHRVVIGRKKPEGKAE